MDLVLHEPNSRGMPPLSTKEKQNPRVPWTHIYNKSAMHIIHTKRCQNLLRSQSLHRRAAALNRPHSKPHPTRARQLAKRIWAWCATLCDAMLRRAVRGTSLPCAFPPKTGVLQSVAHAHGHAHPCTYRELQVSYTLFPKPNIRCATSPNNTPREQLLYKKKTNETSL